MIGECLFLFEWNLCVVFVLYDVYWKVWWCVVGFCFFDVVLVYLCDLLIECGLVGWCELWCMVD